MASNEKIIAALLTHGTIKEAAKAAGVSPRTIYDRLRNMDFAAEYMEAKNDVLRKAVINISAHLSEAIDTVAEIVTNKDINPATRLQAAQTLLSYADKYTGRIEYTSRKTMTQDFTFW